MITIFDLDYTLLDTVRFKENLAEVFNMSAEDWKNDYKKYFKDEGVNYNLDKHLQILKDESRLAIPEDEIKKRFEEFMKNLDDYVFPEAEELIKQMKAKSKKIILATFGDAELQKKKADHLKIAKYFDELIFDDKNKSENKYLEYLKNSGENFLVINDNAKESFKLLEKLGKRSELKLVKGPYSENAEHNERIYDLAELVEKEETKEVSAEMKIKTK